MLGIIVDGTPVRDVRELNLDVLVRGTVLEGDELVGDDKGAVVLHELGGEVLVASDESDWKDVAALERRC